MSQLDITIHSEELISAILRLAAALEGQRTNLVSEPAYVQLEKEAPKVEGPVTLEQIRDVLAAKSKSGRQTQAKDLITKYGALKLTEVNPENYGDLLKEAEGL